jgi:glycosyltransferase involved in cell wall biosynthesis
MLAETGVPDRKLKLVHYGVAAPPRRPERGEARARLNMPDDAFVVSTLARLVPRKRVADLIAAIARLPDPTGRLRLVIGGDGEDRAELEAQATALLGDRALFLGLVHDPTDLYAASDVFAMPSHGEAFGLVFIEAGHFALPSIGARSGGVPDAVLDGVTGLLTPPGDLDNLAGALARLRDDPDLRRRLGQAAWRRATTEFSEEAMTDGYARLLSAG